MSLIALTGQPFGRHPGVFGPRRGLKNLKQVEANGLLYLHGGALGELRADVPHPNVAVGSRTHRKLLLGGEQGRKSLGHDAIHRPVGTPTEFRHRGGFRGVIDHVFAEVDRLS